VQSPVAVQFIAPGLHEHAPGVLRENKRRFNELHRYKARTHTPLATSRALIKPTFDKF
jgi:hypothetical protein